MDRGVVGKLTTTCQGIVMIIKMYSDHTPPCVQFISLILIGNTIQMYAFINTPASTVVWKMVIWNYFIAKNIQGKFFVVSQYP